MFSGFGHFVSHFVSVEAGVRLDPGQAKGSGMSRGIQKPSIGVVDRSVVDGSGHEGQKRGSAVREDLDVGGWLCKDLGCCLLKSKKFRLEYSGLMW